MKQYIYKFTFPNDKVYIGRTDNFNRRLAEHKYGFINNFNSKLYNALRKYGWDNIIIEVIEEVQTIEEAITSEYKYIVHYNSIINGYNSTYETSIGGDVWINRKDTQEYIDFCEKMKVINAGPNNGMFKKKHSEESKQKLKEKAKGRFSLPWFINKYGEEEGTIKYNDRCTSLSIRNLKLYGKI
jgi:group I intron endonuclease